MKIFCVSVLALFTLEADPFKIWYYNTAGAELKLFLVARDPSVKPDHFTLGETTQEQSITPLFGEDVSSTTCRFSIVLDHSHHNSTDRKAALKALAKFVTALPEGSFEAQVIKVDGNIQAKSPFHRSREPLLEDLAQVYPQSGTGGLHQAHQLALKELAYAPRNVMLQFVLTITTDSVDLGSFGRRNPGMPIILVEYLKSQRTRSQLPWLHIRSAPDHDSLDRTLLDLRERLARAYLLRVKSEMLRKDPTLNLDWHDSAREGRQVITVPRN